MTTVTSLFLLDPAISIYLIQAFSPLQRNANMMIGMLRVLNLFAWFSSWLIGPKPTFATYIVRCEISSTLYSCHCMEAFPEPNPSLFEE